MQPPILPRRGRWRRFAAGGGSVSTLLYHPSVVLTRSSRKHMPVATVVRMVASGMSHLEISEAHPKLEKANIIEALEYAASLADATTMPLRRIAS